MGKYRDYANLKTSIRNRSEKSSKDLRISFKPIKDLGNDLLDTGREFISDVATGLGFTSDAESKATAHINSVLNNTSSAATAVDGRTTAKSYMNVYIHQKNQIALIENLSMINALPPIPDNIVDPPPVWERGLVKSDLTSWGSGLIGKDYLQRVIARGQFLTLVPIDISPKLTGNTMEAIKGAAKKLNLYQGSGIASNQILHSVNNRLNNASYGLLAKVNSGKYYKAVNAHMKAAMLSLGIDISDSSKNSATIAQMYKYLPDEIVERIVGDGKTAMTQIQNQLKGSSKQGAKNEDTGTGLYNAQDADASYLSRLESIAAQEASNRGNYNFDTMMAGSASTASSLDTEMTTSDPANVVRKNNYINLLKYLLNIDEGETEIKTMPFSCFYCNGPIERGLSTQSSMGESEIARMTTDIVGTRTQDKVGTLVSEIAGGGDGAEYIKEMAYHRNTGSVFVSNTYIPNVIKSSMIDFQYTVNIRDVAVSSDRFSICRLFWTLSQLWPFVIQTNEPGQALVVPSAPMYCSAFSKGVMNLPRAAITSMSIKTSPEFQTTAGIPTEIDISLTIQPLFTQSTMPNFDKYYDGLTNPEYVAASLFNPLSSFNIIATMCGQNTILTKFQAGLMSFFIGGTVSTFINSVKNTGNMLSGAWSDWWSSAATIRNEVFSRTRILG